MRHDSFTRARDAGACECYRISPAHILCTLRDSSIDRVEVLTSYDLPKWYTRSRQMSRHEARRRILTSTTIAPAFKTVFLEMLDTAKAGEGAKNSEVAHG